MSDKKEEKLEAFNIDKKEEELNQKKAKKRLYKRIRNLYNLSKIKSNKRFRKVY